MILVLTPECGGLPAPFIHLYRRISRLSPRRARAKRGTLPRSKRHAQSTRTSTTKFTHLSSFASSSSVAAAASPKSLDSYRAFFLSKILMLSAAPSACAPKAPAPAYQTRAGSAVARASPSCRRRPPTSSLLVTCCERAMGCAGHVGAACEMCMQLPSTFSSYRASPCLQTPQK